jgi:16S rRNA (guanine527-N7)-methyltransferase
MVFSHQLPVAEQFADLLTREATVRGLIGPREVPRLWDRHILNCAVVSDLMPEGSTVCDVGSGAGLPGLALAIRRPDLRVTLVEPLLRRTTFLDLATSTMGLTNVSVHRGRAEELHGEAVFEVVTSRAVAPMDRLTRWSMPLVTDGGLFLAMKGASAQQELDSAAPTVRRLGGVDATVLAVGEEWLSPPVTVVRMRKSGTVGRSGHGRRRSGGGR